MFVYFSRTTKVDLCPLITPLSMYNYTNKFVQTCVHIIIKGFYETFTLAFSLHMNL